VLAAMARPTLGHLNPQFCDMMEETKTLLRYAFQTENQLSFPLSAPGSVGMESCFVNLVEPAIKSLSVAMACLVAAWLRTSSAVAGNWC
jgi:alanine-glyoxylate transaminase/serine-glyoxylate transaminase/serine-pyruvate transaminase